MVLEGDIMEERLSPLSGGVLSDGDRRLIEAFAWELLGERMQRYTMGDSSSVPVETAKELMKSVAFSIGAALKFSPNAFALMKDGDKAAFLKAAWAGIEQELELGRASLAFVLKSGPKVENRAYHDTVRELALFFKRYDYRFFAHAVPCTIDYQLCEPVPESFEGILYVNEYLRRLSVENTVLQRFEPSEVTALLKGITADYSEQLMGMFEPVLANAFGRALLHRTPGSLEISDADRTELLQLLKPWPDDDLMNAAVVRLCDSFALPDERAGQYVRAAVRAMLPRVQAAVSANRLEPVFPSLYREEEDIRPSVRFIDSRTMDNEQLRSLIDEAAECRFVSDKIAIMKREVHSLRDACEILNTCFWEEEDCSAYYRSLRVDELALLLLYAEKKRGKTPEWASESGWERRLERYIQTLGKKEQAALRALLRGLAQ